MARSLRFCFLTSLLNLFFCLKRGCSPLGEPAFLQALSVCLLSLTSASVERTLWQNEITQISMNRINVAFWHMNSYFVIVYICDI